MLLRKLREVLKYFNDKTGGEIKPMKVKTTLYTGDEMPDYRIYPTIFASERWFTNFDKHLYNRIKEIKNSKVF
ncbi:MAG TPA: hypothetical protein GX708_15730 [Gallicola sp.]|nr:hypothetical protein [Gallicola sp.]